MKGSTNTVPAIVPRLRRAVSRRMTTPDVMTTNHRRAPTDRAVALHAEAQRRLAQGNAKGAGSAARRALALFRRHEGRFHPDVAATLLELGSALEMSDHWPQARRCYQRADAVLQRYSRLRHPDIRRLRVKVARHLCGVCRTLGGYAEGDRHGRLAVRLAERFFGARDLDLAGALNDLGML